jgi:double-strand break repair protein MRE11
VSQINSGIKKAETNEVAPYIPQKLDDFHVEDLVADFLAAQKLQLLPENELAQTVKFYVNKQEVHIIDEFVAQTLGSFDLHRCL